MGRVDDPEPAPDDVLRRQGRAVRERQVRAQVEHDPAAAVEQVPRSGERRPDLELRVERGEALEQLGRDRGAADVALGGRIEAVGGTDQDPDGVGRGLPRRRPRARGAAVPARQQGAIAAAISDDEPEPTRPAPPLETVRMAFHHAPAGRGHGFRGGSSIRRSTATGWRRRVPRT